MAFKKLAKIGGYVSLKYDVILHLILNFLNVSNIYLVFTYFKMNVFRESVSVLHGILVMFYEIFLYSSYENLIWGSL